MSTHLHEWAKRMYESQFKTTNMEKSIIISGPQGSGKTTLAKQLTENLKTAWFNSILEVNPKDFPNYCDVIVIEEITLDRRKLELYKQLITRKSYTFRKPYATYMKKIPAPNFILCTQDMSLLALFEAEATLRHSTHIKLKGNATTTSRGFKNYLQQLLRKIGF